MVERGEIVKLWRGGRGSSGVLASLIRVQGSSYRRPGARMYVQNGVYAGSISGGCLEGEVLRKATWLTRSGAAIERYSTLYDNPFDQPDGGGSTINLDLGSPAIGEMPYGLGCGGVLDVLLEPVESPECEALLLAFEAAQSGESFGCATVLPLFGSRKLARVIVAGSGQIQFSSATLDANDAANLAMLARAAESTELISVAVNAEVREVVVESILPPQRLIVFGAGDDACPLVRLAHGMGWRVSIADGRHWLSQPARFPEAAQVLTLDASCDLAPLNLTSHDAVAMLTHSFEQDRKLLPVLLPLNLQYLGLLGARNRSRLLLSQVAQQLGWSAEDCLARVHAPMGLDLGGDSPEAVALTIVAEIQAVLHAKTAISRRMTEDSFRAPAAEPTYVPAQCPLDAVTDVANDSARTR
jgi:xanthine dehydrogenase accessory factor